MEEDTSQIKLGDVVQVVRYCCCDKHPEFLGLVATVVRIIADQSNVHCSYCRSRDPKQTLYVLDSEEVTRRFGPYSGYIRSDLKKYKPPGELGVTDENVTELYKAEEPVKI